MHQVMFNDDYQLGDMKNIKAFHKYEEACSYAEKLARKQDKSALVIMDGKPWLTYTYIGTDESGYKHRYNVEFV